MPSSGKATFAARRAGIHPFNFQFDERRMALFVKLTDLARQVTRHVSNPNTIAFGRVHCDGLRVDRVGIFRLWEKQFSVP